MDQHSDDQRAEHVRRVEASLGLPVSGMVVSPRTTGFRARIELTPGPDGVLGFRAPRSHTAVAVSSCAVARPEINALLPQLGRVPAFIDRIAFRSDGAAVVVHVKTHNRHRAKALRWIDTIDVPAADIALNGRAVRGSARTHLTVGGVDHHLSPATFYQVNLEVNEQLVSDVVGAVEASNPTTVLDLFSGAGNLSMPLVARGHRVTMMEAHPTATKDARRTAARLDFTVDIQTKTAESFEAGDVFFDVAILDPPRKGAGEVMEQLLLTRPKAVIMVSCNPTTLAADLKRAERFGYRMPSVRLYEMFPHSHHVEAMGVLSST